MKKIKLSKIIVNEKINVSENSTALTIFKNDNFGKLTVLEINGEPWFIGKEIAEILGYGKTNNMTARLDNDQKLHTVLSSISSNVQRKQIVINESGLYCAIFGSQKHEAKIFRRWVTDEVLPSIRKTGSYALPMTVETRLELFEAKVKLERKLIISEEKLNEAKPLIEFAEQVTKSADSIDFETFSKLVKDEEIPIGRNRLYKWMRTQKYIMDNNLPYQHMLERGFLIVVETTYHTSFGIRLSKRIMITPIGQVYFCNKLKREFK